MIKLESKLKDYSILIPTNVKEITPEHLLYGLLKQEQGVVSSIISKLSAAGQNIQNLIEKYFQDMKQLFALLPKLRDSSKAIEVANMEKKFLDAGVPLNLAQIMSRSGDIPQLLNIIILANETKRSLEIVAKHYFSIGEVLRFDWLRKNLIALPENNKWQALSRSALLTDGFRLYSNLVRRALLSTSATEENFIQVWMEKDKIRIQRIQQMFDELQGYKVIDLAMLSAILRELEKVIV